MDLPVSIKVKKNSGHFELKILRKLGQERFL